MTRIILALAIFAGACSQQGPASVPLVDACLERAEAWCDRFARCEGAAYPSCVQSRLEDCLANVPDAVPQVEQEACLEALESGECGDSWPLECAP